MRDGPPADLAGGTPQENAGIARRVLAGDRGAYRDGVLFAAAMAVVAADRAKNPREGAGMAAHAIDSGSARAKLDSWIRFTNA